MSRFLFKIAHGFVPRLGIFTLTKFSSLLVYPGSIIGLILYAIYLQPVTNIMIDHNLQYYQSADDTQLYKALNVNHLDLIIQTTQ